MAVDNKSKTKNVTPEFERRNFWRGVIAFLIMLFVIGSIGFGCYVLKLRLFADNKHFVLRHFAIDSTAKSSSRWSGDEAALELASVMGVSVDETNIFQYDLAELRMRALIACPGIERLSVERVLPDTLKVRITERMPQAVVFFINQDGRRMELAENARRRDAGMEPWAVLLVDANSVLMSRQDCAVIDPNLLPQVTFQLSSAAPGARIAVKPGDVLTAAQGAMALLSEARKRKSNLQIKSVMLEVRDEKLSESQIKRYIVRFSFDNRVGTAVLPLDNVPGGLDRLEDAVVQSIAEGDMSSVYDLTFKNQVIKK